jgi:hypothetical protein
MIATISSCLGEVGRELISSMISRAAASALQSVLIGIAISLSVAGTGRNRPAWEPPRLKCG